MISASLLTMDADSKEKQFIVIVKIKIYRTNNTLSGIFPLKTHRYKINVYKYILLMYSSLFSHTEHINVNST